MDRRMTGSAGEDVAARFLISKGFKILQRNYFTRYGEIDIIAADSEYIVFAEVKTRRNKNVLPCEAVGYTKQKRIISTAAIYLNTHENNLQPRFDIIEVWPTDGRYKLRHIKGAFICRSE